MPHTPTANIVLSHVNLLTRSAHKHAARGGYMCVCVCECASVYFIRREGGGDSVLGQSLARQRDGIGG